jgi:hypothetical protein
VTTATASPPRYVHSEAQLESLFRLRVRTVLGGRVEKLAPTKKGIPDRLVLLPLNRIWLVELKTETGSLSAVQREWHRTSMTLIPRFLTTLHGLDEIDTWVRDRAQEYDHLIDLVYGKD